MYSPTPGKVSVTGSELIQGRQSISLVPLGPKGPPKSQRSLRCWVLPLLKHTISETFHKSMVFSGQQSTVAEASIKGLSRSQMLM